MHTSIITTKFFSVGNKKTLSVKKNKKLSTKFMYLFLLLQKLSAFQNWNQSSSNELYSNTTLKNNSVDLVFTENSFLINSGRNFEEINKPSKFNVENEDVKLLNIISNSVNQFGRGNQANMDEEEKLFLENQPKEGYKVLSYDEINMIIEKFPAPIEEISDDIKTSNSVSFLEPSTTPSELETLNSVYESETFYTSSIYNTVIAPVKPETNSKTSMSSSKIKSTYSSSKATSNKIATKTPDSISKKNSFTLTYKTKNKVNISLNSISTLPTPNWMQEHFLKKKTTTSTKSFTSTILNSGIPKKTHKVIHKPVFLKERVNQRQKLNQENTGDFKSKDINGIEEQTDFTDIFNSGTFPTVNFKLLYCSFIITFLTFLIFI
ncbi:hypothetical protein HANVADRAFT_61450 [Hanseniaspora valbyensis NRRL Y-1626]|uniref:Uncharacterized protein n=1 Tax=Hanseniaspora valbyensis NRRL Y-1626 TaxID=766949 RepID=A0A1B7TH68_9ASCO|nr:hypothetical protein HANVADRAFT_61450 [Hanseniaspora valbyensis NRRL Y-1626]